LILAARLSSLFAPLLKVPPASRGEPRTGSVPPARRGNLKELIRVQHLGSLRREQTRFFRPHPQPLSHIVGEGRAAREPVCVRFSMGGSFASALHIPLSRLAGEGDTGGEGKKVRLPLHACAWKTAPASATPCRTVVPLSDLKEGVFNLACFCKLCPRDWYKCLHDMISTCEWGQTRRSAPTEAPFCRGRPACLPLQRYRYVGADLRVCPYRGAVL